MAGLCLGSPPCTVAWGVHHLPNPTPRLSLLYTQRLECCRFRYCVRLSWVSLFLGSATRGRPRRHPVLFKGSASSRFTSLAVCRYGTERSHCDKKHAVFCHPTLSRAGSRCVTALPSVWAPGAGTAAVCPHSLADVPGFPFSFCFDFCHRAGQF